MGTLNDCYWLAETRRERMDDRACLHWSKLLMRWSPGLPLLRSIVVNEAWTNIDGWRASGDRKGIHRRWRLHSHQILGIYAGLQQDQG